MAFVPSLALPSRVGSTSSFTVTYRPPRRPTLARVNRRVQCCTPSSPSSSSSSSSSSTTPEPATASDTETTSTSTPTPMPSAASSETTESSATASDTTSESDPSEKPKPPFEIRGFSLANVFLGFGAVITLSSFSSFLNSAGTASATSLGFVYGVPILLVGCALKYAELQPVPVSTSTEAESARETRATSTQKQIHKDITRHRYGDEGHLQPALSSLGLIPRGEPCPVLQRATERATGDGEYEIEMEFYSVATPYKTWVQRMDKYDRFFGPGVNCSVRKIDAENRIVGLTVRSTGEAPADK